MIGDLHGMQMGRSSNNSGSTNSTIFVESLGRFLGYFFKFIYKLFDDINHLLKKLLKQENLLKILIDIAAKKAKNIS